MKRGKVAVVGIWHLGAVISACLSDLGHDIVGFDPDQQRVDKLNRGIAPLYEPELEESIRKNILLGRLHYDADLRAVLKDSRYVIIAFDTPISDQDEADLSPIMNTLSRSAPHLEDDCLLIISSQVPVGSCEKFASVISMGKPSLRFGMAYVPENLRLGNAMRGFKQPDMVVIGSDDSSSHEKVDRLYSAIDAPRVKVSLRTAEMIKHAINAYLGMQISFINEIANLSDELGIDALKVTEAMRLDSRIGSRVLKPGLGFAGGTLARDLRALQKLGRTVGYETDLVNSILKVNEGQNRIVVAKLRKICGSIHGLSVGVLGLAYKPGTSSVRRSASLEIIGELIDCGAKVKAYDPKADIGDIQGLTKFRLSSDPYAVAENSDVLIVATAWAEFKELEFRRIKSLMKRPVIIDAQNMLDPDELVRLGFTYVGIGRGHA